MKVTVTILYFFMLLSTGSLLTFPSRAQDVNTLIKEARQYESSFKEKEALQKYLEVLKVQPQNLTALCKSSELYNSLGKRLASKNSQKEYYLTAKTYAQKALQVNANSVDANFAMALAMGRMAMIASGQERINAVKDIKTYAEKTIQLDPNNFKGYHVLGKWYYEVSNLNSLEKLLVKMRYGALPAASLTDAIRCFEKSKQLNPGFALNYLELARSFHRNDEEQKAIQQLEIMMKLPNINPDDATVKEQGKKLLQEWK